jgi:hypothetical protein
MHVGNVVSCDQAFRISAKRGLKIEAPGFMNWKSHVGKKVCKVLDVNCSFFFFKMVLFSFQKYPFSKHRMPDGREKQEGSKTCKSCTHEQKAEKDLMNALNAQMQMYLENETEENSKNDYRTEDEERPQESLRRLNASQLENQSACYCKARLRKASSPWKIPNGDTGACCPWSEHAFPLGSGQNLRRSSDRYGLPVPGFRTSRTAVSPRC